MEISGKHAYSQINQYSICAIIVSFNPEISNLKNLISILIAQSCTVLIIDNGSHVDLLSEINLWIKNNKYALCCLLELGDNLGIACAQNQGIRWAQEHHFKYVLFLDQDSELPMGFVSHLYGALSSLQERKVPVAAVGPQLIDKRTQRIRPFGISQAHSKLKLCELGVTGLQQTDFIVSSGMLAPVAIFDEVGLFEEKFFIDNVDLEWCFRVTALRKKLYGSCNVKMQHSIGEKVLNLGRHEMYFHNSIRQYYMMRNRVALYRKKYVPAYWIIRDVPRAILKFIVFSVLIPPQFENFKMMMRGLKDAICGKFGKYL